MLGATSGTDRRRKRSTLTQKKSTRNRTTATEEELETSLLYLMSELPKSSAGQLERIAAILNVDPEQDRGRKITFINLLISHMNNLEGTNAELLKIFQKIHQVLVGAPGDEEESDDTNSQISDESDPDEITWNPCRTRAWNAYQPLATHPPFGERKIDHGVSFTKDPRPGRRGSVGLKDPGNQRVGESGFVKVKNLRGSLHEFKIKGSIGNPGQEGKLDYRSLSYQIQSAKERGYSEQDICAAVINCITPGIPVRSYLEGSSQINLQFITNVLRAHFKIKDSTSAFNELTNSVQGPSENEMSYCMRLMGLRQDVLI